MGRSSKPESPVAARRMTSAAEMSNFMFLFWMMMMQIIVKTKKEPIRTMAIQKLLQIKYTHKATGLLRFLLANAKPLRSR